MPGYNIELNNSKPDTKRNDLAQNKNLSDGVKIISTHQTNPDNTLDEAVTSKSGTFGQGDSTLKKLILPLFFLS